MLYPRGGWYVLEIGLELWCLLISGQRKDREPKREGRKKTETEGRFGELRLLQVKQVLGQLLSKMG